MVGPALPSKAEWAEFKAERNDFKSGTCEHCNQPADKLIWHGLVLVCASCREWLEQHGA